MNKTLLGIEPIIYIKDGSKMTFYLDLTRKDYKLEDISQITYLFTQDNETCVFFKYYDEENTSHNIETGYDEVKQAPFITIDFGDISNDTSIFALNAPIYFEMIIEIAFKVASSRFGDSFEIKTKTLRERQPNIILTEGNQQITAIENWILDNSKDTENNKDDKDEDVIIDADIIRALNKKINGVSDELTQEIIRAKTVEDSLKTNIQSEALIRETYVKEEAAIRQSQIANEATIRKTADDSLATKIKTVEDKVQEEAAKKLNEASKEGISKLFN